MCDGVEAILIASLMGPEDFARRSPAPFLIRHSLESVCSLDRRKPRRQTDAFHFAGGFSPQASCGARPGDHPPPSPGASNILRLLRFGGEPGCDTKQHSNKKTEFAKPAP
jgi:hypothetical protein